MTSIEDMYRKLEENLQGFIFEPVNDDLYEAISVAITKVLYHAITAGLEPSNHYLVIDITKEGYFHVLDQDALDAIFSDPFQAWKHEVKKEILVEDLK